MRILFRRISLKEANRREATDQGYIYRNLWCMGSKACNLAEESQKRAEALYDQTKPPNTEVLEEI